MRSSVFHFSKFINQEAVSSHQFFILPQVVRADATTDHPSARISWTFEDQPHYQLQVLTKEANYSSAKHGLESEKNQCCLFPRNRFCSSASKWGGWRTSGCSSREKGSKWWRRRRWWEAVARPSSWTPSGKGCSRRTPGTQFNREKNLA